MPIKRRLVHLGSAALLILLAACGAVTPEAPVTERATAATPANAADSTATTEAGAAGGLEATLNVFAAASLSGAFDEIGATFEGQHPGVTVAFNYAGSNQLAQQIVEGAPADVFASANLQQMDVVVEDGAVAPDAPRTFVRNRLVVVYPDDNPAEITTLNDLARPGVKIVLAAPEVPVGQYALAFLEKASQLPEYTAAYSETVLANVVSYEENVRAVLSKITLGEADAGIVYTSDIASTGGESVGHLDIPDELNTIATYPIAPIRVGANVELAARFVEYVLTPEGQAVLERHGFIPAASDDGATATPAQKGYYASPWSRAPEFPLLPRRIA